jgi:hypothetical protein
VSSRALFSAGALACAALLASCGEPGETQLTSREPENGEPGLVGSRRQAPAAYRPEKQALPTTAADLNRAIYVAGLSVALPPDSRLLYPQGIDSAVMIISGPGYQLSFDDYGAFQGKAVTKLAGAPAGLTEKKGGRCRFRHWEVKLPAVAESMLVCDKDGSHCHGAPAHANISTYCTGVQACAQVDAIVSSARFSKAPWPRMPLPDPHAVPEAPPCGVDR